MPRPRQKVSVTSLAKEFNVSAPTISKALSNSKEVSESLRSRVRARAEELDFIPNRLRRKTFNICAVLDFEDRGKFLIDGFQPTVIEGIYDLCSDKQLEFSLLGENTSKLEEMDLTKELCVRNADAAVIIRATGNRRYFDNLIRNRFPFACVYDGPEDYTVKLNDYKVGQLALSHLVELGHERIAIARHLPGRAAFGNRFIGFIQSASQMGLAPDAVTEIIPNLLGSGYKSGNQILRDWEEKGRPWTAIFCTSDNVAIGILSEAATLGIRIPAELSVLTCDNLTTNAQAAPPLSVVDIPNQKAGYLAAELVWNSLTQGSGKTLQLPPPLDPERVIQRTSTGRCGKVSKT